MSRNDEGVSGEEDLEIPAEVADLHFERYRRNDVLRPRGRAGLGDVDRRRDQISLIARGVQRPGVAFGDPFPDDEGYGERIPQRQRHQQPYYTKIVPLTLTQRENAQMELQIDEFQNSPAFTTTLLIEYNRGYNRIGFKLQPVYPGWESVSVSITKPIENFRTYDRRLSEISTKMGKLDNGDALYVAVPIVDRGNGWNAELRFSTAHPQRREREGQPLVEPATFSSNEDSRNFQAAKMYMDEKYSDFTFICEYPGEETIRIPVHKVIVGPSSPYFQSMFLGDTKESQRNEAVVNTFRPEIVKEIFYYIYHGKVSNQACSICSEVVKAADYFQLDGLRDHCMSKVGKNIDQSNVLDLVCLAGQFGGQDIAVRAKQFIDTYITKEEAEQLYSDLIRNNPEAAINFFVNT
ncbi:unnamed protein product [Bursaphelenchus xylophilus]|uniref:(pine wood nematode) hypothetical protein n=1 Tax=Bursaphelenchus xylophilus TaxID=6326 RepID=A0A1I7S330_BURXY|nr:unnamed protein product [Bursaphelenchus xylophilus]CAG9116077.1 unnamed protein product [Bursaphelenchus xylophilus]